MKRILFSFISLVLLTNCLSLTKIDENLYNQDLTRTFNRSKEQTFNATILAFKELKVGIEKQDKEKGIIVTEKVPFYEMVYLYGNQYQATGQQFTAYHKYYLQITGDKNSATVRTVKYRLWNNNVEQTEVNARWTKENVWDPFFKEIQIKLDGY